MKAQPALIPVRQMQMQLATNTPVHFDAQLRHDVVQILAALLLATATPKPASVEVQDEEH